jgi:hypothetical protein
VPRNGSGVFSPPGANYPAVSNTLITAANRNAVDDDISTALTASIAVDGQSVVTANIPFGGNKLTGVGAATVRTDAATLASIQDGTGVYVGTVGGTADAITLTPSPAVTALVAGMEFWWIASGANTTAVTVAVSGLAAKALTKYGAVALVQGDILSGELVGGRYDGTRLQLLNTPAATLTATSRLIVGAGAPNLDAQVLISGPFSGVNDAVAMFVNSTITIPVGGIGFGVEVQPVFVLAGSGTHPSIASLTVNAPTASGAAAVAQAATLNVAGAPTFGTLRYSMLVGTGAVQFAGPNIAIGGNFDATVQLYLQGNLAGVNQGILEIATFNPVANANAFGIGTGITIQKAGSGTHANFDGVFLQPPTVGAGAASLTNASTLRITAAPTGATNNRALWVQAGVIQFDGTLSGTLVPTTNGTVDIGASNVGLKRIYADYTNTATVGAVTINKMSGRCIMQNGASSVVVTNSLVTAASHVNLTQRTFDGGAPNEFKVVEAAGSFAITALNVLTANDVVFNFFVLNAD